MIDGDHFVADPFIDFGVGPQVGNGSQPAPAERIHRSPVGQILGQPDSLSQRGDVGRVCEEVVHDPHRRPRIGGTQRHFAFTPRMQQYRMDTERVFVRWRKTGEPNPWSQRSSEKQQLHIRCFQLGAGPQERLQGIRQHRGRTRPEQPCLGHGERDAIGAHQATKRPWAEARPSQPYLQMIPQVAAHRQIDQRCDADVPQMRCRTDARQHEQLRRVEHAAAQYHFAFCLRADRRAVVLVLDARRPSATQCHLRRKRMGLECQVGAVQGRFQIGVRRRGPAAVVDRPLTGAEAERFGAVRIIRDRPSGKLPGLLERSEQRIGIATCARSRADPSRLARDPRRPPTTRCV